MARKLFGSVEEVSPTRARAVRGVKRDQKGDTISRQLATVDARSGSSQTKRFRIESQSVENGLEQVILRTSVSLPFFTIGAPLSRSQLDSIASKTTTAAYLENPEIETRWYFKYFLGKGTDRGSLRTYSRQWERV